MGPDLTNGCQLVSFLFEITALCQRTLEIQQQICISPEAGVNQFQFQGWHEVDLMLTHHSDGWSSSKFGLTLHSFVTLWVSMHSVCWRAGLWDTLFRILASPEVDNLPPFNLKSFPSAVAHSKFNDEYVYRQKQGQSKTSGGAKWTECALILGTAV